MSADWKVKIDLEGNILCRFKEKCQGHYLWYAELDGFSHIVKGVTTSITKASSGITQKPGPCSTVACIDSEYTRCCEYNDITIACPKIATCGHVPFAPTCIPPTEVV